MDKGANFQRKNIHSKHLISKEASTVAKNNKNSTKNHELELQKCENLYFDTCPLHRLQKASSQPCSEETSATALSIAANRSSHDGLRDVRRNANPQVDPRIANVDESDEKTGRNEIEDLQVARLRAVMEGIKEDTTTASSDEDSDGTDEVDTSDEDDEENIDDTSGDSEFQRQQEELQKFIENSGRAMQMLPQETISNAVGHNNRPCTYDIQPTSCENSSAAGVVTTVVKEAVAQKSDTSTSTQSDKSDVPDGQNAPPSTAAVYIPTAISPTPGWFAKFYERYTRPGWDSSPYKAACNKPAWDQQVYEEARERFLRHETVKARRPGRRFHQFMAYPMAVMAPEQQFNPGMQYPSPLFEAALMQSACFQRPLKAVRLRNSALSSRGNSKSGSPRMRSPSRTPHPKPSATALTISSKAKITTRKQNAGVEKLLSTTKNDVPQNTTEVNLPSHPSESVSVAVDENNNVGRRKIIICPAKVVLSKASTRQSDYSSSWRRLETALKQQSYVHHGDSTAVTQQQDQKQLLPIPRVAYLSKPNCRHSRSGNGGYYSQSVASRVPTYDNTGRAPPEWDSSPFIPAGKKNAWDETMPKLDQYRLRRFGWT